MSDSCTPERFLRDVQKHEIQVIRDDGVNRHIRFKRPGSSSYYFDLVTWPGTLCCTGDMGTYVFQRTHDMFAFFRTEARPGELRINRSYWSEKLVATDCNGRRGGSVFEYIPEVFERVVKEKLVQWWRDYDLTTEQRRALRKAVEIDVLDCANDGEVRACDAAVWFSKKIGRHVFEFRNFWETNLSDYTFHFTWCCYALIWGIHQYDQHVAAQAEPAAAN